MVTWTVISEPESLGSRHRCSHSTFVFGVSLGSVILRHSDNLSKSLKHEHISAAEGQEVVKLTHDVLQSLRQPEQFKLFYQRVLRSQENLGISPPTLPRKRRAPSHLETGSAEGHFHASLEDHYRQIYYEALDLVITSINARFDHLGYQVYRNVQGPQTKGRQWSCI